MKISTLEPNSTYSTRVGALMFVRPVLFAVQRGERAVVEACGEAGALMRDRFGCECILRPSQILSKVGA